MTPTTAATGKQITITNTKDVNNFVYSSLYSLANLSFNAFVPFPMANLVSWYDMSDTSTVTLNASLFITEIKDKYGTGHMIDPNPDATYGNGPLSKRIYSNYGNGFDVNTAIKSIDPNTYPNCTYFACINMPNPNDDTIIGFAVVDGVARFNRTGLSIYGNCQTAGSAPAHLLDTSKWWIISYECTNGGLNFRTKVWNHVDTTWHVGTGTNSYAIKNFSFGKRINIGEAVLYTGTLTDANALLIANTLKNKWAP
jgi:hypothetical protein